MADLTIEQLERMDWSTETTLVKLLNSVNGGPSVKLLAAIAKKFNISAAVIQTAVQAGVIAAAKNPPPVGSTPPQSVKDKSLETAIKDLKGSLLSNLKGLFDHSDVHSVFGVFGATLSQHSNWLKNSNGELKEFAAGLKLAAITIGGFATLTKILDDVSSSMTSVYANGILFDDGLTGLVQASSDAGLRFTEFAAILTKFGAVSASLGTKTVVNLNKKFQDMTRFGGDLMMNQKESSQAFFETLEMMRNSGELLSMSDDARAARGKFYLQNLNELALATGRNRDELRKATADLMKQPFQFLWARALGPDGAGQLTVLMSSLSAEFGDASKQMASMIEQVRSGGGGFGLLDEQMRPLISLVPGFASALQDAAKLADGTAEGAAAATQRLGKTFDNMSDGQILAMRRAFPAQAAFLAEVLAQRKQASDSRKRQVDDDQKEADRQGLVGSEGLRIVKEQREESKKRMEEIQGSFNKSRAAFGKLYDTLGLFATRLSGVIIPVIDALSSVIEMLSKGLDYVSKALEPLGNMFGGMIKTFKEKFGSGPVDAAVGVGALVGGGLLLGILGKIIKIFMGSGSSILGKFMGFVTKMPVIGNLFKFIGNIGTGIASGIGGIFKAVGGIIKDGALAISEVIKGLGAILGAAGEAIGMAVGGILKGVSGGLSALGKPQALLGAGVLGILAGTVYVLGKGLETFNNINWESMGKAAAAIVGLTLAAAAAGPLIEFIVPGAIAIATAIGLIGAAVGAASWLAGKGLPLLSEGLSSFANIDGESLVKTGLGMTALAGGLVLLTGSEIVSGIGSLISGFSRLFSADPISKLKAFADISEPLNGAATALKSLAAAMPDAMTALSNFKLTDDMLSSMDKLKSLFNTRFFSSGIKLEDLNSGIFAIFAKFSEQNDTIQRAVGAINNLNNFRLTDDMLSSIDRLKSLFKTGFFSSDIKSEDLNGGIFAIFAKFSEQKDIIQRAVDAINNLNNIDLTGFAKLRDLLTMGQQLPGGLIANLADVFSTPRVIQGIQQITQPGGRSSTSPQTSSSSGPTAIQPVITTDDLNTKTIDYYETTVRQFNRIIELLQNTVGSLDDGKTENKRGFDDLSNAMTQMSGIIR